MMKQFLIITICVSILPLLLFAQKQSHSAAQGIINESLAPCPNTPNCARSPDQLPHLQVVPSDTKPIETLAKVLGHHPNATIIMQTENYLHAEFKSSFFKFIDDVEFLWIPSENIIQIRSQSRKGYTDFGVNYRRLKKISDEYERASSKL